MGEVSSAAFAFAFAFGKADLQNPQDAYLRPATAVSSRSGNSSTAPLATGGAQPGRRSSFATDSSAADGAGGGATATAGDSDDDEDDTYKAGVPIGLLAAIGELACPFRQPLTRSAFEG